VSLAVIVAILTIGVVASLVKTRRGAAGADAPGAVVPASRAAGER
jgi:hypothetical protein